MTKTRNIRKVVAEQYGTPEELRLVDDVVAEPGTGEVTVEVRAIGVNPLDAKILGGLFGRDPGRLPVAPGVEFAGVVVALGDGVGDALAVGDAVAGGMGAGAYASAVTVPAAALVRVPEGLGLDVAAGAMVAGGTAAQLVAAADAPAGATIVIHGASGAVGRMAAQLALAGGLRVVGTASERHHDDLRRLGVTPVVYGSGLEDRLRTEAPDGVSAVLDAVGNDEAIDASLTLVDPSRIFTIAAFHRLGDGIVGINGAPDQPAASVRESAKPGILRALLDGSLSLPIVATFPLEKASEALTLVATGRAGGKVILVP